MKERFLGRMAVFVAILITLLSVCSAEAVEYPVSVGSITISTTYPNSSYTVLDGSTLSGGPNHSGYTGARVIWTGNGYIVNVVDGGVVRNTMGGGVYYGTVNIGSGGSGTNLNVSAGGVNNVVNVTGNGTLNGTTVNGTLNASGSATLSGTNIITGGGLEMSGGSRIMNGITEVSNSNFIARDSVAISGGVVVNVSQGDFVASDSVTAIAGSAINVTGGNIRLSDNVQIQGSTTVSGGNLVVSGNAVATGPNSVTNGHLLVSNTGKVTGANTVTGGNAQFTNQSRLGDNATLTVTDAGVNGKVIMLGDSANPGQMVNVGNNVVINADNEVNIRYTNIDGNVAITSTNENIIIQDSTTAGGLKLTTTQGLGKDISITNVGIGTDFTFNSNRDILIDNVNGRSIGGGNSQMTALRDITISNTRVNASTNADATKAGRHITLTNTNAYGNNIRSDNGNIVVQSNSTVGGPGKAISAANGSLTLTGSRIADNTTITTGTGLTWQNDSRVDSDVMVNNTAGNVNITGAKVGDNVTITTAGTGDININMSTSSGSSTMTSIGDNADIRTAKGNINLSGGTFGGQDYALVIGANGLIQTGDGDVNIHNVKAGAGTKIVTLNPGISANTWNLTGDLSDVQFIHEAKNADKDTFNIRDWGKYAGITNRSGVIDVNIYGGHTGTIRNESAAAGTSTYTLYNHLNSQGGLDPVAGLPQEQVVTEIIGQTRGGGVIDKLVVKANQRFSEYTNIVHSYQPWSTHNLNAQVNRILEMDMVTLEAGSILSRTSLEIGKRDGSSDAQFIAGEVTLNAYSDLFIHRDNATAFNNVIDKVTPTGFGSVLWIDRTTIGSTASQTVGGTTYDGSFVQIGSGGMITGYMEEAGKNNILGNLFLGSGAILNPYSVEHYDPRFLVERTRNYGMGQALNEKGVGLKVASTGGSGVSGSVVFDGGVIFKSRLFATQGGSAISINDGSQAGLLWTGHDGDWIESVGASFTGKGIFDPTFGNDNELYAKQGFKLYQGDGSSSDTSNTYYYNIVRSQDLVSGLNGQTGTDILDNSMFNNQIIKSDMLGEWNFEMDSTGENVLLRFRLLAKHPTQGGIATDMIEPNAEAAARQIDRIRYPFDLSDATVRYNGDMYAEYRQQNLANSDLYPNYKEYYIRDFEELLLNIQNVITSGAATNEAIRKLHPEPYADLAAHNFTLMDSFVAVREQHGVSSIFQVEVDNYEAALAAAEERKERRKGSTSAYASLFDDYCVEQFVTNPIRFWAAGFGADGRQNKVGTEYGYDIESWGGAVGMTKEFGDVYMGITGGYARNTIDWRELAANAKTDAFMADAVVGLRLGMGFVEAFGNYAYNEHTTTRSVSFANYTGIARGEYHDDVWGAGIRLGYQKLFGNGFLFIPTIGVNYIQTESGKFTEKGRYDMSVLLDFRQGDIRRRNVRVPITARLNRSFALGGFVLTPEVRGAVSAIMGDKRAKATTRFVGDPSGRGHFSAVGVETGRWAAQVGGSLELSRRGRFSLSGNYDYTFARKSHEHNYSVMMGMNF